MDALVLDPDLVEALRRERALSGADRFDEVWDGVYVMSPIADNLHQRLAGALTATIWIAAGEALKDCIYPGVNVSDRDDDWTKNYRCPDVAVFLPGTSAEDRETHWFGGPDFAVEIVSKNDRSRRKLEFYAAVGVRELLILDRNPWALELYRPDGGELRPAGVAGVDAPPLASEVLGLTFGLAAGPDRPRVVVARGDGTAHWAL